MQSIVRQFLAYGMLASVWDEAPLGGGLRAVAGAARRLRTMLLGPVW